MPYRLQEWPDERLRRLAELWADSVVSRRIPLSASVAWRVIRTSVCAGQ